MKKNILYEVYWIRALACLAVVLVHAVNTTLANYEGSLTQFEEYMLIFIRFAAFYGTPAFVFISELLLARAYPEQLPHGFFTKRVRFLLIPFAVMGLLFAAIQASNLIGFFQEASLNLFAGGYTGYFVLIIFQFYILHALLHKKMSNWPALPVLLVAFFIQMTYLAFFNFTEPRSNQVSEYIWLRGHWLPFTGWIFYFALGFYVGRNYENVKKWIVTHKKTIFVLPVISILIITVNVRADVIEVVSSKRLDNVFYTVSMIAFILFVAAKVNRVPGWILFISKYSFNIYLLHTLVLYPVPSSEGMNPFVYAALLFILALFGSILVARVVHVWSEGEWIIGKTLPSPFHSRMGRSKGY
ncbi:acyltransferase family protein [Alteribacter aurantiacus]|uniref:acyltransferase family protein n=1 Tax=Alteribacter aurantiacus TaxID=254410 RepID=UPI00041A745D|nr:acyltransferase family protein [Alteribacter aurantiacus]